MNRRRPRRSSVLLSFCAVLCLTLSASADDGWSMPNLNPFASKPKSSTPTRKISESKSSSGWSLNPFAKKPSSTSSKSASSRRKSEPSLLTKTWEAVTPWDDHPAKKPAPLTNTKSSKSSKSKEKGWFDSMFGPEEEPRKPRTVNEWLDQEKPGF